MRRPRLTSLLAATAAFAAFGAGSAQANTLYVSPSGHDATGCRQAAPCQTIGAAVAQAATGDTVSVAGGTYRESVSIATDISLIGIGRPQIDR
ncbi:MAG TPA: hypothetical protein VG294_10170 [Solirubrobacteraceae bacterium]|jgi:hypothetical protein|nr:hypothetical protein [Solirubrobacteraceae bacterium]